MYAAVLAVQRKLSSVFTTMASDGIADRDERLPILGILPNERAYLGISKSKEWTHRVGACHQAFAHPAPRPDR